MTDLHPSFDRATGDAIKHFAPLIAVIAAIAVPNLATDARPLGDERKFFIFHR